MMETKKKSSALQVAVIAILTAVVVVFTMVVKIPTARGYLNLSDVAILFIALTFGPWTAFLTAGLGAALADLLSGYAQWAPVSFVCHGFEGLFVALIICGDTSSWLRKIFAYLAAVVMVVGGYFLLSGLFIAGFGVAAAEIPGNFGQVTVGFLLGLAVSLAVVKAYPPVRSLSW